MSGLLDGDMDGGGGGDASLPVRASDLGRVKKTPRSSKTLEVKGQGQ